MWWDWEILLTIPLSWLIKSLKLFEIRRNFQFTFSPHSLTNPNCILFLFPFRYFSLTPHRKTVLATCDFTPHLPFFTCTRNVCNLIVWSTPNPRLLQTLIISICVRILPPPLCGEHIFYYSSCIFTHIISCTKRFLYVSQSGHRSVDEFTEHLRDIHLQKQTAISHHFQSLNHSIQKGILLCFDFDQRIRNLQASQAHTYSDERICTRYWYLLHIYTCTWVFLCVHIIMTSLTHLHVYSNQLPESCTAVLFSTSFFLSRSVSHLILSHCV